MKRTISETLLALVAIITVLTVSACSNPTGGGTTANSVATPTFTPNAGKFTSTQTVSIESSTAGATIYYTIDGTEPTTSSDVFDSSTPIEVALDSRVTVRAIAVKDGLLDSDVAEGEFTASVYSFTESGDKITITGYHGSDTDLTLPSTIIGKDVVAIGDEAFKDNDDLTKVTIPDSVVNVGKRAFYKCNYLRTVIIGDGVTVLDDGAFQETTDLTDITVGSSLETIWYSVFYKSAITEITLPASVKMLAARAFSSCSALTTITLEGTSKPTLQDFDIASYYSSPFVSSGLTTLYVDSSMVDEYNGNSTWLAALDYANSGTVTITAMPSP